MRYKLNVILRGVGQVMFQNNPLSGILMLVGLAIGSWEAALLALAGNGIGNLTARLCRYPEQDIRNGLYGFNGTLVGIAVGIYFGLNAASLLLLIIGAALSTGMARFFAFLRKPGFTAPFILATWILLGLVTFLYPSLRTVSGISVPETSPLLFRAFSFSIGQVMFEGSSLLTGLLFLAGIFVNDRRGGFYAFWGAVLPLGMGLLVSDFGAFNAGLYGYNGVLCGIALAGKGGRNFMWATLSVLLSVVLQWLGISAGIITLTAPFVVSVWTVMALRSSLHRWQNTATDTATIKTTLKR